MAKTSRDPFEVKIPKEQEEELTLRLIREVQYAEQARYQIVGENDDIDRWHEMYEGGNASLVKNDPWPGAANLTSPLVTEKVDALRSRIVSTIFTDPIWIVEGFGDAAQRAPFVESYMQWKAESERLQQIMGRGVHNSLIEGTGVIEVCDRVVMRKQRQRKRVRIMTDPQGQVLLDPTGNIQVMRDDKGKLVDAKSQEPSALITVDLPTRSTGGPSYRVLSLRNFFLLPGHASERSDLWGYAKRFYRRRKDLERAEKDGYYRNIDQLTMAGDREQTNQELRAGQDVAPQYDKTAEKEIWEVTFLDDLDDDGYEEWYVATFSARHGTLLRLQYQDYNTPHYILLVPFPRPDSVYGYSFAWHKLGTLYEEHTAIRNMIMDRSNLVTNAPFLVVTGSLWNPSRHPFGPRQRIPVRSLEEIKQLEIRDVPGSLIQREQSVLGLAERVSGMNDVALGVNPQQDRTFSEVRMVAQQSFIRIDEVVRNLQEGLEDLFSVRLMIYKYKLEDDPEPMPDDILRMMEERGYGMEGELITSDLLDGDFRGKPHGSVENADLDRMRADFVSLMTAITQLVQAVPPLGLHFSQPNVVRSFLLQMGRTYRWFDMKGLLGGLEGTLARLQQMQMQGAGMPGMPPGGPGAGMPPGMPPGAPQLPRPGNPGRQTASPRRPQPGPVNG